MKPAPMITARLALPASSRSLRLSSNDAQDVDARQVRERRNALGHKPCRDDQLVVAKLAAVGQRQSLGGGVDRSGAVAQGNIVMLFSA